MRGIEMTAAQVEAYNRKHHGAVIEKTVAPKAETVLPKDRMNATERAFSLILEAQKRRGDILEWRFEGISLAWGIDPRTGKAQYYTPDFFVIDAAFRQNPYISDIRLLEIKGAHVFEKDRIRYRGCRACWPRFQFEFHQKTKLGWNRIE